MRLTIGSANHAAPKDSKRRIAGLSEYEIGGGGEGFPPLFFLITLLWQIREVRILDKPRVYFSRQAFQKACKEADRWYYEGLNKKGKPFEAVAFPLSAINLKPGMVKCPAEIIQPEDVISIVVTQVVIPPDVIKNYSPNRANFRPKGIDAKYHYDLFIKTKISPITARFPLLTIISCLHSHPFSGKASLSPGDKKNIKKDDVEARKKGYNLYVSFLLTPKEKVKSGKVDWKITAFLVRSDGVEIKLDVELVKNKHPEILKAKRQPFYKKNGGRKWEKTFIRSIKKLSQRIKILRWGSGWTSYWFKSNDQECIIFLPPFFPEEKMRVYVSANGSQFKLKTVENCLSKDMKNIKPEGLLQTIVMELERKR